MMSRKIIRLDRGSPAWRTLQTILATTTSSYIRLAVEEDAGGQDGLAVKAGEGMWTAPLSGLAHILPTCPADWGSATASQRCALRVGHIGPHVDLLGERWSDDRGVEEVRS
jgi:hypothetical protein